MRTILALAFCLSALALPTISQAQSLFDHLNRTRDSVNSRNDIKDNYGRGLDGLQIQQEANDYYIGVYHTNEGNDRFCLRLVTSKHTLGPYIRRRTIDCNYASQGALQRLPDGRYVLAFEKNDQGGHPYIQFRIYENINELIANRPLKTVNQPHTAGINAQGTPNFRWIRYNGSINRMTIEFGFHQNRNGRDINAIGFLRGFRNFDHYVNENLNQLVDKQAEWHIGDRSFLIFEGRPYTLIEAMTKKDDWLSWRLFLHDETANTLKKLDISTSGGSKSMGNGAVSFVRKSDGQLQLVSSAFVFGPSPNPGQHIYVTNVQAGAGDTIQNVGGIFNKTYWGKDLPHQIGHVEVNSIVCNPNERGHLSYGPYDNSLPHAPLRASFQLAIDSILGRNDIVVNLDIFDSTTGEIVAERNILRTDFKYGNTYQWFHLNFDWRYRAGHRLEARVYSYGKSAIRLEKILIRDR